MGHNQSKSKPKQQKQQKQKENKPFSPVPQKKLKNLSFPSTITESTIQKFLEKEDPIADYKPQVKQEEEEEEEEEQTSYDINDYIDFKLIPRYKNVKLSDKESTNLPVMISLEAKAPEMKQDNRPPIDLVCVIDDSGSMSGKKAQLVRKSLKYLLKLLNSNDRICLISYDCNAKVLTPFLRNNEENKEDLKKAIKYIDGKGSTNTTAGMEHGLWMLKNRKQKNPVSCMFLLSDGQDNCYNSIVDRISQLVNYYDIKDQYTINTYGYGCDHNPDVMLQIAKMKDGNFYFIENLKKVSDWFILSLSGLLTVLGEKIQIRLKKQKNYEVSKYFGDETVWDKDNIIHLPHLTQSCKKEYLLELTFPKQKELLKDEKKQALVLQSILKGFAIEGKQQEISITQDLNLQFLNHNEPELENELIEAFEVAYLRAKGGEIIGEACDISKKGEYEKANKILDDFMAIIDNNPFKEHRGIQFIRNDIIKSKDVCKPRVFEQKGKAFMYKKNKDHLQRQASLCSIQDWDENQKEMFQNYEEGNYQLSSDSCCSSGEEDNQFPPQQLQIKQKHSYQRKYSDGSVSSYSSHGSLNLQNIDQNNNSICSRKSSVSSRNKSFIEDDILNVQQQVQNNISQKEQQLNLQNQQFVGDSALSEEE